MSNDKTKITIEWFKKYAESKGGKCFTNEYINQNTQLTFRCSCGFVWTTSAASIRNVSSWCPKCAGVTKPDIQEAHELAHKREGKCLSTEYVNAREKLQWECKHGHKWGATLNTIRQERWCNICAEIDRARSSNYSSVQKHWKTGEDVVCVGAYEAAVVLWLNNGKIDYDWQKHIFTTPLITTTGKESTYTPDLYLKEQNLWVEIKGYMYEDASQKWQWFHSNNDNSELWDLPTLKSKGIFESRKATYDTIDKLGTPINNVYKFKITVEKQSEIIKLANEGHHITDISKLSGVSKPTVIKFLKIKGIKAISGNGEERMPEEIKQSVLELAKQGICAATIAERLSVGREYVSYTCDKYGIALGNIGRKNSSLSVEASNKAIEMATNGKDINTISKELGITYSAAYNFLKRRGF